MVIDAEISLFKLQEDLHRVLKTWHEASAETDFLGYLQIFQQARQARAGTTRQAINQFLFQALEVLAMEHEAEANLLRRRFLDGLAIHVVANQLNVSEATAYRKQQEALKLLAQAILAQETQARADHQANLAKQLKLPSEAPLFGVEEMLQILLTRLVEPALPWLLSIEGLGGIGKTALANALVRRSELPGRFVGLAWVSAKQHDFFHGPQTEAVLSVEELTDKLLEQLTPGVSLAQSPQEKRLTLSRLLKQAPYCVIIDNLETVTDYQVLLPVLREWADPSKFVLTSRYSVQAYPEVYCLRLTGLNPADTVSFIRHEATARGLVMLATAPEEALLGVYDVVGGNPLALKLVIGQVSILPLSQVLANLQQARGQSVDALYTYIYWQAWQLLDRASREVLLVMPLAQDGPLAQLLRLTHLDPADLGQALQQLVTLSLVQASSDLEERRYTIHRLTETFLLHEVAKWQTSL